jgi:hypothetical protein
LRTISTVSKVLIILLSVLVCLAVTGCDEPTPTPTPAPLAQGPSLEEMMADYGIYDIPATPGAIADSRNTMLAAADALGRGDKIAFLGTLSVDLMPAFESADFSQADPARLGAALSRATVSLARQDLILYDTVVDGISFQIRLVPEDGTWKIDAL